MDTNLKNGWVRSFALALSIVLGFCFFSFLLLEWVLRTYELGSAQRVDQTAFSNVLGDLKPNQDLVSLEKPEMPYHVHVNSQGLRGPDLKSRDQIKKRILVLGDSITFGQFVNEEETLAAQIRSNLAKNPANAGLEIVNAGRCGYSINDELSYYQEKGKRLNPDILILVYSVGDEIEKSWGWHQRVTSLERGIFRSQSIPILSDLDQAFRKSAAVYWLQERYWLWILHSGTPPRVNSVLSYYSPYQVPPVPEYVHALTEYREDFKTLLQETEKNGTQLVWVLFPSDLQLKPETSRQTQDTLLGFAKELEVPVLDLLPLLKSKGDIKSLYYYPVNNHPRAIAYQHAGKKIAQFLEEGYLDKMTTTASVQ